MQVIVKRFPHFKGKRNWNVRSDVQTYVFATTDYNT